MSLPLPVSEKQLAIALSRGLPKYFSWPEVQVILEAAKADPKKHLFLNFLWQTGTRVSEAIAIRLKDVDLYGKAIRVPNLKRKNGSAERIIPIKDSLVAEISTYALKKRLQPEDKLFKFSRFRAYQIVKEACRKAGITDERAHPHTFRHSYAINLLSQGVPIIVVQKLLGHSNIKNTLIYLQIIQEDARKFLEEVRF